LALLVLGVVVVVAAVVVCEFLHAKPFGGVACSLGPYQGWASGVSVCVCASAWGAVAVVVVCVFLHVKPFGGVACSAWRL
jgi:hypothetical protein